MPCGRRLLRVRVITVTTPKTALVRVPDRSLLIFTIVGKSHNSASIKEYVATTLINQLLAEADQNRLPSISRRQSSWVSTL
jgi:hypothetical protein